MMHESDIAKGAPEQTHQHSYIPSQLCNAFAPGVGISEPFRRFWGTTTSPPQNHVLLQGGHGVVSPLDDLEV